MQDTLPQDWQYQVDLYDWLETGPDLAGDTNWDQNVDIGDLAQIAQHWLSNCSQQP